MTTKQVDGFLLVDKPLEWTSFDVVNKVRYRLAKELGLRPRQLKVGHAGTLDPLATGLLIVLVGRYTKKQTDFMKKDKAYKAQIRLGQTSSTDDNEGKKVNVSDNRPKYSTVKKVLENFIGQIEQTPPKFSAVKIGGRPAYSMARAGQQVKLKPKTVRVHSIENVKYEYPELEFTCHVSSGTYIRSLARDIGNKLKTGAYLNSLRRLSIGGLVVDKAIKIGQLDKESVHSLLKYQS